MSNVVSNPAVIIGMGWDAFPLVKILDILYLGLTTLALLGMFKKSIKGDRLGAQQYMQLVLVFVLKRCNIVSPYY